MVSAKAYAAVIARFLDNYQDVLSKKMIVDISNVYEWTRQHDKIMSERVTVNMPAEEATRIAKMQLDYMKKGALYLKKFIKRYEDESAAITNKIYDCRMALLGRGPFPKWCSESTKNKLIKFEIDLKRFTSDIIGCADAGTDFFLSILKKIAPVLGENYVKIKNDMELTCIRLRIEILKLSS